jgi:hypothetical protein
MDNIPTETTETPNPPIKSGAGCLAQPRRADADP